MAAKLESQDTPKITDHVEAWLVNDGHHVYRAANAAEVSTGALERYVTRILRTAPKSSAAWECAQELSPRDYDRVDWQYLAGVVKDVTL